MFPRIGECVTIPTHFTDLTFVDTNVQCGVFRIPPYRRIINNRFRDFTIFCHVIPISYVDVGIMANVSIVVYVVVNVHGDGGGGGYDVTFTNNARYVPHVLLICIITRAMR